MLTLNKRPMQAKRNGKQREGKGKEKKRCEEKRMQAWSVQEPKL